MFSQFIFKNIFIIGLVMIFAVNATPVPVPQVQIVEQPVKVNRVVFDGTGCPQADANSISATISGNSLRVEYKQFNGNTDATKKSAQIWCVAYVEIDVPDKKFMKLTKLSGALNMVSTSNTNAILESTANFEGSGTNEFKVNTKFGENKSFEQALGFAASMDASNVQTGCAKEGTATDANLKLVSNFGMVNGGEIAYVGQDPATKATKSFVSNYEFTLSPCVPV